MDIKEIIKSWGLPEALQDEEVVYHFVDGMSTEYGEKFILKNKADKELFIMDFSSPSESLCRAFSLKSDSMKLQFINVPDVNYRRKGIAGFYLAKLLQFTKQINFTEIRLNVVPDQRELKKYSSEEVMDKEQLRAFYEKYLGSDPSVKLTIGLE